MLQVNRKLKFSIDLVYTFNYWFQKMEVMKKETRLKTIKIKRSFEEEVSALCEVLQTNFSHKTKEFLLNWKIAEERRLKNQYPDLYQQYLDKIKKPQENPKDSEGL